MSELEKKYIKLLEKSYKELIDLESNFYVSDFEKWKHDVLNVLKQCLPKNDQRLTTFNFIFFGSRWVDLGIKSDWINYKFSSNSRELDIAKGIGIISSVKESLEKGLIGDIRTIIRKEYFDITLENAFNFLNEGHLIGAGVYGRIIIENTLRDLCEKSEPPIEWGRNDKLTKLRDELRKNDTITEIEGKEIGFWINVGNSAAHGNLKELKENQIKSMLTGLQDFLIKIK